MIQPRFPDHVAGMLRFGVSCYLIIYSSWLIASLELLFDLCFLYTCPVLLSVGLVLIWTLGEGSGKWRAHPAM